MTTLKLTLPSAESLPTSSQTRQPGLVNSSAHDEHFIQAEIRYKYILIERLTSGTVRGQVRLLPSSFNFTLTTVVRTMNIMIIQQTQL